MAKKKSSKKGPRSNNRISNSSKEIHKKENPFEVKVNKRKFDNLGKILKHEHGRPGVSRSQAYNKRKETLLKEYQARNKNNAIKDNRIGAKVKNMPEEEKLVRRSAAEKARRYKKDSIFNLNEDSSTFTHKGAPLLNTNRFEKPLDDSDSEDEALNEKFVSKAHFSGFLKVKSPEDTEAVVAQGQKTHKEIIDELILNSKKRKFEKLKESEENLELVSQLDDEFKDPSLRSMLFQEQPKSDENPSSVVDNLETESENCKTENLKRFEDYNSLIKQLQLDRRISLPIKTRTPQASKPKQSLEPLILATVRLIGNFKISNYNSAFKLLNLIYKIYLVVKNEPKYIPEVIAAVNSLLCCFCGSSSRMYSDYCIYSRGGKFLFLGKQDYSGFKVDDIPCLTELPTYEECSWKEFSPQALNYILQLCVKILLYFCEIYQNLPSGKEIFLPSMRIIHELLENPSWPNHLLLYLKEARSKLEQVHFAQKSNLEVVAKKPKPLKLYEPLIEENFDGSKKKKGPKEKREVSKLNHAVKKEFKSAIREIKKDTSFLARQKLKDQLQKDKIRQMKVKQIMGSLADQEGEYRKIKRNKSK